MRYLSILFLTLILISQLSAEEKQELKKSKTGTYVLTDFGKTGNANEAKKTMNEACQWIIQNGSRYQRHCCLRNDRNLS